MKILSVVALVVLNGSIYIGAELPRSSPEAQGVSSSAVLSFVEAAEKNIDSMNSFMFLRHGYVLAEGWWSPYKAASPHSLYSLSKSFTSTAVGLAISEGRLRLDDEVLKFFPEDAPAEPSNNLKAMRVSDLLRMSTGHQTEWDSDTGEVLWKKQVREATAFALSPDGKHLFTASGDNDFFSNARRLEIWDTVTGERAQMLAGSAVNPVFRERGPSQ